jgi:hypothetical protein
VNAMGLWARQNRAAIEEARRRFDAAAKVPQHAAGMPNP